MLAQDGGRTASLRTLETAYDAGINFFDTADIYSQGESEVLIGKASAKGATRYLSRARAVIAFRQGES
jgi:aryl-alcohol dehydrogenase-like predicted oxidoreductase